jgi:hypothetical protein
VPLPAYDRRINRHKAIFSFPDLELVYSHRLNGEVVGGSTDHTVRGGTRRRSDGEPKAREPGGFGAVLVSCCRMGRSRMGSPERARG